MLDYSEYGRHPPIAGWVSAIKDFHLSRFTKHLNDGTVLDQHNLMPPFFFGDSRGPYVKLVEDLRSELGLPRASRHLKEYREIVERHYDTRSDDSHDVPNEVDYDDSDQGALVSKKESEVKKYFDKIVRELSRLCPVTGELYNERWPSGFEGMLEHVKDTHPKAYWITFDFFPLG